MDKLAAWLAALGAGLLGAMGLGGGSVLLLYLTATQMSQRAAQGVNLLFILPVGLCGLWFHRKNGLLRTRLLLPILLGGAAGVLGGSLLAGALAESLLRRLFGLLLLALGLRELLLGCKLFAHRGRSL